MKKKSVISLIKYYTEKNDVGFRSEAYEIAKDFDASGDYQLAEYIMSLLSNAIRLCRRYQRMFLLFLKK